MDLREIGVDEENWIRLAQDRIGWRAFVNTVLSLRVPWSKQTFLWKAEWVAIFRRISCTMEWVKSRDSSVGIALGYGLDDRCSRVRFPAGAGNFSLHYRVQNVSGSTQPPMQWVPGALSLGVERLGREADHSPPSSSEVKEWVELYLHSPNTPPWRGAQLKHRDNFMELDESSWRGA
jgi:hypothetical protein